jgi:hypothetical protein
MAPCFSLTLPKMRFGRPSQSYVYPALALLCGGLVIALSGCALAPVPTSRIVTPTSAPTPVALPTTLAPTVAATATPVPSPIPTATPQPTPVPALAQATVDEGMARAQALASEDDLVCLRYEDTDIDGVPEWVALIHGSSATGGRLSAFILDGEAVYALEPAQPKPGDADVGFGQYPTCDLDVRDVNADGTPELAIFGYADGNKTLLHLFAWEAGSADTTGEYRRLGFFSGDAGVKFADVDGDLEEEIWEGYRVKGAPNLAFYIVFTWENNTYGWTSEHYDWYYTDRPQTYPTGAPEFAVVSFYLALNDHDVPGAYALLSPSSQPDYDAWALGYVTTLRVSVGGVHTVSGSAEENNARVAAMVTSWDNEGGVITGRLWDVEWDTVRTDAGWQLVSSTSDLLETWPVTYWP